MMTHDEFNVLFDHRMKKLAFWEILDEGNYKESYYNFYKRIGPSDFIKRLEHAEALSEFKEELLCVFVPYYDLTDEEFLEEFRIWKDYYGRNSDDYCCSRLKKLNHKKKIKTDLISTQN